MYTQLYWQEASDKNVRGYYAVDKYGLRHKVTREKADQLKETMTPTVRDSNVMTLNGFIKETIWNEV